MFENIIWEEPRWLLLFILLLPGLFWRRPSGYISKAHSHLAPFSSKNRFLLRKLSFGVPVVIKTLVLVLIIAALADITAGYVLETEEKTSQRVITQLDVSGSMYGFAPAGAPFDSITCEKNGMLFPRIKGACRALHRLVDEVEKEIDGEDHPSIALSLQQFAYNSAVVSYPSTDYDRFREKIKNLEFKIHGLGYGTHMHLALWDMFLLTLERNRKLHSGFTFLAGRELAEIYNSLAPGPKDSPLHIRREIAEKLEKIKQEMKDTVFVVITDAVVYYLQGQMTFTHPSIPRLLQLAERLEIPVYIISTDEYFPELERLVRRTGFGPRGGPHRGDFLMVRRDVDEYLVDELVAKILQSRLGMTVSSRREVRESYAGLFLAISLTLLAAGILWNKCITRSLTDPE